MDNVYREAGYILVRQESPDHVPEISILRLVQDGIDLFVSQQDPGKEAVVMDSHRSCDLDHANDNFLATFVNMKRLPYLDLIYCFGPTPDVSRLVQQSAADGTLGDLIEQLNLATVEETVEEEPSSEQYAGTGYGMYL